MCLEKKKSKKLLNSHRKLIMQPHDQEKNSRPTLKALSDLGSRDTRKIFKKKGEQTRKLLKRSVKHMTDPCYWTWPRFEAMGDDDIPKNDQGRDKPTCSQWSFNWFSVVLS